MPVLDPSDPRKVPDRPIVTSFCDTCHALTKVTQIKSARGINWLCDGCKPGVILIPATPHSPPPPDPAPSPAIEQWIEPEAPLPELTPEMEAYLAGEEYIPRDILDEAIDNIASPERESELIGAEQHTTADDQEVA